LNLALEILARCVPLHIDAASIHSRWEAGKSNDFEGKVVFAEGPHPAEPERKWEELAEDDTPETWFWTDASRKEENTAVGILRMEAGKFVERRGLRLRLHQPSSPYQPRSLRSRRMSISELRTEPSSPTDTLRESTVARSPTTRDRINKSNVQSQRSIIPVPIPPPTPAPIPSPLLPRQPEPALRERKKKEPVSEEITMQEWEEYFMKLLEGRKEEGEAGTQTKEKHGAGGNRNHSGRGGKTDKELEKEKTKNY
jgi:hypothetical protein